MTAVGGISRSRAWGLQPQQKGDTQPFAFYEKYLLTSSMFIFPLMSPYSLLLSLSDSHKIGTIGRCGLLGQKPEIGNNS